MDEERRKVKDMKKQLVMVGIIVVLITVGLSGCTQENSSSDLTKIQSGSPTTESLETILDKTDSIESMYYEIAASITMPQYGTQTAAIKIWQKLPYIKEEISSVSGGATYTILVIHRPEGNYTYDTEQGRYVLTPNATSFATSLQYLDSGMIKSLLENQTVTNLAAETIDGKQATVIQYSLSMLGLNITIKMWIWNDYGVPLKAIIDMTMEETSMTMDFRFSKYSFSDIPDGTFSVS